MRKYFQFEWQWMMCDNINQCCNFLSSCLYIFLKDRKKGMLGDGFFCASWIKCNKLPCDGSILGWDEVWTWWKICMKPRMGEGFDGKFRGSLNILWLSGKILNFAIFFLLFFHKLTWVKNHPVVLSCRVQQINLNPRILSPCLFLQWSSSVKLHL